MPELTGTMVKNVLSYMGDRQLGKEGEIGRGGDWEKGRWGDRGNGRAHNAVSLRANLRVNRWLKDFKIKNQTRFLSARYCSISC